MDIYYIENRIQECKNAISENNYMIKQLRDKINEFEYVIEKLKETQGKFYDYREFKRAKFVTMKENFVDMKFANSCADSMINFINGQESKKSHEGIDESIQITNKKIQDKEEEIAARRYENVRLEDEILELEREKEKLKREG